MSTEVENVQKISLKDFYQKLSLMQKAIALHELLIYLRQDKASPDRASNDFHCYWIENLAEDVVYYNTNNGCGHYSQYSIPVPELVKLLNLSEEEQNNLIEQARNDARKRHEEEQKRYNDRRLNSLLITIKYEVLEGDFDFARQSLEELISCYKESD